MKIEKATLKDIAELEMLINGAYRGEGAKKGWTTEADILDGIRIDKERLQEMIQKKDAVILRILDDDHTLKGCVYLEKMKNKMYLGMLTVSPNEQAKGIGKKLLREAEIYAQSEGCRFITMTVISVRSELIAWYEKHGYYKTGEKKPFPTDVKFGIPKQPLEFVVMEKSLESLGI
jgi:ribosomal protein S18 acetylase RimI-like enzyme